MTLDLTEINQKIKKIKREDVHFELLEKNAKSNPFEQFISWFNDALEDTSIVDPTIMVLATTDKNGYPDTRVVLLKELEMNQFIFYSNYDSSKATQISHRDVVAINFYWQKHERQVRIKGNAKKLTREKSETYFATRPRKAQLGAHAWVQSTTVSGRSELDNRLAEVSNKFSNGEIPCPENWGGYVVTPFEYEFFQGRSWRVHDRLKYTFHNNHWEMIRLAP